jgi:hypothetical protein
MIRDRTVGMGPSTLRKCDGRSAIAAGCAVRMWLVRLDGLAQETKRKYYLATPRLHFFAADNLLNVFPDEFSHPTH